MVSYEIIYHSMLKVSKLATATFTFRAINQSVIVAFEKIFVCLFVFCLLLRMWEVFLDNKNMSATNILYVNHVFNNNNISAFNFFLSY